MKLLDRLSRAKFLPPHKLLEYFPPFFFMGMKIVSASKDSRRVHVKLPLRWYGKNPHGTMFGGFMCALADPIPTLMCSKVFKGVDAWTKSNHVDFLRPGKGALDLVIEITDKDVAAIHKALKDEGKTSHTFEFYYRDSDGRDVARVRNTVHLRQLTKSSDEPSSGPRRRK